MKKTVVLRKLNLVAVFVRTAVPLVVVGAVIGALVGAFIILAGEGGAAGWLVVLQVAVPLAFWGLLISVAITILAALYNIFIHLTGGLRLSADDREER